MDEASSKYFVGQDTSPMRKPKCTHWASIWLSKTKSSEFVSRVVFGKLHAEKEILERCQQPVRNVFVERHAAAQRRPADDARSQYHVIDFIRHHAGHGRDEQRSVLVIRVKHDDYIGARGEGFAVAGLLIASIAVVAVVLEYEQAHAASQIDGAVGAVVVHQNADVHKFRQFSHRDFEGLLRVVGGHYDRDALGVDHGV